MLISDEDDEDAKSLEVLVAHCCDETRIEE
jgi:hypothetical protein